MSGWRIVRTENSVTVSRHMPVRFDLAVVARLPLRPFSRTRLAHQIRQDIWRALQKVRGFSPAVRIEVTKPEIKITAGGCFLAEVSGRSRLAEIVGGILEDPGNRARWMRHAGVRC